MANNVSAKTQKTTSTYFPALLIIVSLYLLIRGNDKAIVTCFKGVFDQREIKADQKEIILENIKKINGGIINERQRFGFIWLNLCSKMRFNNLT